MKKIWLIIINVLIMASMLTFVFVYSNYENEAMKNRQINSFKNSTVTMESITENYLEGEQRICDVWAHYIESEGMTIDEATDFIRTSHVLVDASAHLIYCDTLTGKSTKPSIFDENNYDVSYANSDIFKDTSWIDPLIGDSINVSRSFYNSIDGKQSIAFCNFIKLMDGGVL